MQKPRKIPQRQCLGCREMKNKKDLIRVVRPPEGEISLDFKGKAPGGGRMCVRTRRVWRRRAGARRWSGRLRRRFRRRSMRLWRDR